MKVGDKIKIICIDDCNGKDTGVHRMNGVIGSITHIDDMGQIYLDGYVLSSEIPNVDEFEIIEQ